MHFLFKYEKKTLILILLYKNAASTIFSQQCRTLLHSCVCCLLQRSYLSILILNASARVNQRDGFVAIIDRDGKTYKSNNDAQSSRFLVVNLQLDFLNSSTSLETKCIHLSLWRPLLLLSSTCPDQRRRLVRRWLHMGGRVAGTVCDQPKYISFESQQQLFISKGQRIVELIEGKA